MQTAQFFPKHSFIPQLTHADHAIIVAQDFISSLKQALLSTRFNNFHVNLKALQYLATIFQQASELTNRNNAHYQGWSQQITKWYQVKNMTHNASWKRKIYNHRVCKGDKPTSSNKPSIETITKASPHYTPVML